jgi:hypothetical protein
MGNIQSRLSHRLAAGRGDALPLGPRMPSALQAAVGWALRPLPFMDRCYARYGESVTLRVRTRRPWVFLTDPDHQAA